MILTLYYVFISFYELKGNSFRRSICLTSVIAVSLIILEPWKGAESALSTPFKNARGKFNKTFTSVSKTSVGKKGRKKRKEGGKERGREGGREGGRKEGRKGGGGGGKEERKEV